VQVGKMGIPDNILLKPGPLNEAEWAIMRQHPTYAYELLSQIDYLRQALDIPHYHHEKWDGSGYPYHLEHEHIPLTARIFSIVDVWDALRSNRPYCLGWPEEKVQAYLLSEAGRHFDPNVVSGFMSLDLASVKLVEASD
jgi:response regulator RpfG family c-di-GMP phosphodiesterase